jgi:hypothetical protein
MPISLLFGCSQIETCVANLVAARSYMGELLGAVPVEQELARQIAALMPGSGYDVDHLECGGAVFQINQPGRGMEFNGQKSIHQVYLDERGPCVTNLNYYVDDIGHARGLLTNLGAPVHIEGPSTVAAALADYGPDNTRPGGDDRPFLFMGTRHLIGFDLEIMEPNFWRLADQSTQFPAFIEPRPAETGPLRLHRLVVVVKELGATWDAIETIFAPGSRSKPYARSGNAAGRSFRLGLGGMEIEYCEAVSASGPVAAHLREHGPGIAAAVFGFPSTDDWLSQHADWQTCDEAGDAVVTGIVSPEPQVVALCRERIGFDVVLEAPEAAISAASLLP